MLSTFLQRAVNEAAGGLDGAGFSRGGRQRIGLRRDARGETHAQHGKQELHERDPQWKVVVAAHRGSPRARPGC